MVDGHPLDISIFFGGGGGRYPTDLKEAGGTSRWNSSQDHEVSTVTYPSLFSL